MSDFTIFVPGANLTATKNLVAFIEHARSELQVFGADLDFSSNEWNITGAIVHKAQYDEVRLLFNNLQSTKKNKVPMQEPFLSFAKAYMRYKFGLANIKNVSNPLVALRTLEFVLLEKTDQADPTTIDASILNRAAQVVKEQLAPSTAYHIALQLASIGDFLRAHRLTAAMTIWKSPLKRPEDKTRIGGEHDEARAEKLPTPTVLDALPRIFREATESGDVITVSACALMCSAPDRVNEVLLLREACEVEKQEADGKIHLGLRWWPAKGAEPQVKWIVGSMSDVVREAIAKIRKETDEARVIARWYEQHPQQLYLPKYLEHLRTQEWLTLQEIGEVVFSTTVSNPSVRQWCQLNGVELHKRTARSSGALFADVETAVIRLLPSNFPVMNEEVGLKYSEALFLVKLNALHEQKTTYRGMFEPVSLTHVANRLGRADDAQTIFDRFGFYEPDGSRVYVKSHQFRHYLNTLGQAGGLSQLDIAKWSGRKDLRQNAVYDHESSESILIKMRKALGHDKAQVGPLFQRKITIISRDEFARLKIPTAHTTDFGYCVHDYVMSPCQINRDCLNCEELVCIKGQQEKENRVRQSLREAEMLVAKAQAAVNDGDFGAEEWLEAHLAKLNRLTELVQIFDDPSIAEGSFVHQAALPRPSRMDHAHSERLVGNVNTFRLTGG
jgi:hypothetical protein